GWDRRARFRRVYPVGGLHKSKRGRAVQMAPARLPETMFFLDRSSAIGLQAQIRESVVSAILARQAVAGAAMPSTRRLAQYLGVSRITVTLAYQELASQGFLEVSSRSGFRVAGDP